MITDLKKKTLVKWNAPVGSNNFDVKDVLHCNKLITVEGDEILGKKTGKDGYSKKPITEEGYEILGEKTGKENMPGLC